jgi:thioredoxin 1
MEANIDLIELTDNIFNDYDKGEKYILYFTANWCIPCKQIYPFLCELNNRADSFNIYKIDVDENEMLVDKFKITSMPTFILIKDKQIIDTLSKSDKIKLSNMIKQKF